MDFYNEKLHEILSQPLGLHVCDEFVDENESYESLFDTVDPSAEVKFLWSFCDANVMYLELKEVLS